MDNHLSLFYALARPLMDTLFHHVLARIRLLPTEASSSHNQRFLTCNMHFHTLASSNRAHYGAHRNRLSMNMRVHNHRHLSSNPVSVCLASSIPANPWNPWTDKMVHDALPIETSSVHSFSKVSSNSPLALHLCALSMHF